jgi:hypothetical protein
MGIAVGLWYLTIFTMALRGGAHSGGKWTGPLIILATLGLVTIGGCIYRLSRGWRPAAGALGGPARHVRCHRDENPHQVPRAILPN